MRRDFEADPRRQGKSSAMEISYSCRQLDDSTQGIPGRKCKKITSMAGHVRIRTGHQLVPAAGVDYSEQIGEAPSTSLVQLTGSSRDATGLPAIPSGIPTTVDLLRKLHEGSNSNAAVSLTMKTAAGPIGTANSWSKGVLLLFIIYRVWASVEVIELRYVVRPPWVG